MQMRGLDAFFEADTCSANLATLWNRNSVTEAATKLPALASRYRNIGAARARKSEN